MAEIVTNSAPLEYSARAWAAEVALDASAQVLGVRGVESRASHDGGPPLKRRGRSAQRRLHRVPSSLRRLRVDVEDALELHHPSAGAGTVLYMPGQYLAARLTY